MTLYDIDEALALAARSIDDADGEVTDAQSDAFDALLDARDDKADAYIALIKNAEAEADAYDAELKRLAARKRAADNTAARLKSRLLVSMERHGEDAIEGRLGKVRRQRSASSRVELLADPADLPERFQRVTVAADKTALKAALEAQDPDVVRLAEMVPTESFHVRIY